MPTIPKSPKEVYRNIYIGNINHLKQLDEKEWAFLHATERMHYQLFGWNKIYNKPPKNHPNYIWFEKKNRFSLNWVDGNAELFEQSGIEIFIKALDFIEKHYTQKKVFIHCDLGMSRSPTIVLLFLAKRLKSIRSESFENAQLDFKRLYPFYNPGGIAAYVSDNWGKIT